MTPILVALTLVALGPTSSLTHTGTLSTDLQSPGRLAAAPGGGVYVTEQPTGRVLHYDGAGALVAAYSVPQKPIGIAVGTDGRIFISRADGTVGIYDATFASVGSLNPAPLTLTAPNDIAVHPTTGEVYVTDSEAHRVLVFNGTTGALARSWGSEGAGLGLFESPQAIAIDASRGRVLVTDADNFRVQVFDTAGVTQFKFGYRTLYVGNTQVAWLARSEGLALDSCGNIYLSDALMGTVRVFSPAGQEIDAGFVPPIQYGINPAQVRLPCDVLIDSGNLYVASTGNSEVEIFAVSCAAKSGGGSKPAGQIRPSSSGAPAGGEVGGEMEAGPIMPDNPFDIVAAMDAGTYARELDVNRDRQVNVTDLEIVVNNFGGATVEDFLAYSGDLRDTYPYPLQAPHLPSNLTNICGRCHSMNGAPGGMLTDWGQENLCLSCHTTSGRAMGKPVELAEHGNNHPIGVSATTNGVPGPAAGSELALHLDNGDIRCATCHDPHETVYSPDSEYLRGSLLDGGLCAECHTEVAQWQHAGHADEHADAWGHYDWALPSRAACRRCHSGYGYMDFADGVAQANQRGMFRVADCTVCHAAHGKSQDGTLLRVFDTVTLPANGPDVVLTDVGGMATCMACHNGRVAPEDSGITPHYALGGVMLEGINGITFGYTVSSSPHSTLADCMDCHMAQTPAAGLPGSGKVGGHTFHVKVTDAGDPDYGFENVANACNTVACHGATARSPELQITEINRTAFGDYDGDATIEGVQDETQGLLDAVLAQILAKGAIKLSGYPYWDTSGVAPADKPTVEDCIWNWQFVTNSGDLGVHNTSYTVGLLQVSYRMLAGQDLPGAFLRYGTPVTELPKTVVEITSVNGGASVQPGGAFTVNFTIEDDQGNAIAKSALDRLRLYITGPVNHDQRLTASADSTLANFVQNPDGSYTYTRPTAFPTVYAAPVNDSPAYGAADGEWTGLPLIDGTYQVLVEARRTLSGVRKAGDAVLDFVVDNDGVDPPVLASQQLVTQAACNSCHSDLQLHGGNRKVVAGCTACHNIGAEDDLAVTPGLTINLMDMVHHIHLGAELPQVTATANSADPYRYAINGDTDFSEVGFPIIPAGASDCTACHAGAAQGDDIYANITRANCRSCHDDIDFTTGTVLDQDNASVIGGLLTQADLADPAYREAPGGITHAFPDDTTCALCHGVGMFADVKEAHQHPTDPQQEGLQPAIDVVSVTGMTGGGGTYFQAGDRPAVQFKLRNSASDPLQLVSGNRSVADRLEFIVGGPTTLYQTIITSQRPWSNGNLATPAANWVDNFAVDGTYTFIMPALPANYPAQLNSIGDPPGDQLFSYAGGWGQQYSAAGTPLDTGAYTVFAYGRRTTPTAGEREPFLSDQQDFSFGAAGAGAPYSGTVATGSCNACHGVLAFHGNSREGVLTCLACHTAGTQDGATDESVDLRIMVHRLHNARNLPSVLAGTPYQLNGFSGVADFSHLLISSMPGEAAECQVCHVGDVWKNPPQRDNMRTWMVACTSCHDGDDTAAHVAATTGPNFAESCASCHGDGTAWAIEKSHHSP